MKHIARFYVSGCLSQGKPIVLSEDQQHHAFAVLRLSKGDCVHLFNDKFGEWGAKVVDRKNIVCEKLLIEPREEKGPTLAMCLIHANKFSFMLEKATELGVSKIIPIVSQYSQYKTINYSKCQQVIVSACEQSCRLSVPELSSVISLPEFVQNCSSEQTLLIGDTLNSQNSLKDVISPNCIFLVGPEGGFSDVERKLFSSHKYIKTFHYGNNVLRSETAAIAFLSCWLEFR